MTLELVVWALAGPAFLIATILWSCEMGFLCADYIENENPSTLKALVWGLAVFIGLLSAFVFAVAKVVSG